MPKSQKKKTMFSNVLQKHRNYIKNLEAAKINERDEVVASAKFE
jgi:hypothetical protein